MALIKLKQTTGIIGANGSVPFTADQPMGGFKLTGLGAPTLGGDATNKTYVDAIAAGIRWKEPVQVRHYIGSRTIVQINALTPATGDAVVATTAGTPTAGTSDALAIGDIAEFDGTSWKKITTNVGGFPPAGTFAIVSEVSTLFGPLVDGTDDGKVAFFDGTSLTPTFVVPTDGIARLVSGDPSVFENSGYVFDGTVPTGVWNEFTGLASITAGLGLLKTGNILDVRTANGVQVVADFVVLKPKDDSVSDQVTGVTAAVIVRQGYTASVTVATGDPATGGTVGWTQRGEGDIMAFINGKEETVGNASKTQFLYFSGDAGVTARAFTAVVPGDTIHVGSGRGYELDTNDTIQIEGTATF